MERAMSAVRWNATVVDSPGSEPFAVVGDLVVAVRTPRSRDFVTVEVAPTSECAHELARPAGVRLSPRPSPCITAPWHGEVHVGTTVGFELAGSTYRLTLAQLAEDPAGSHWIRCELCLERD
jgi:hypothetical protein